MKNYYNIGKVAKVYHLNADTIRHYEELGLISPERGPNGYRLFDLEELSKIDIICDLRKLNFSLDEIGKFLSNRSIESSLSLLDYELEVIRSQISALRRLEKQVYSRINNLVGLSYRITDACSIINFPDRNCLRYPLYAENDMDYFIAAREIQDALPDSQYMIGNMNIGRELSISYDGDGNINTRFDSVVILDDSGDSVLKGGTYISLVFKGGSKMAYAKLRDIDKYAKENGYVFDGNPILLILTDSHELSNSNLWLDEFQVRVRKADQ